MKRTLSIILDDEAQTFSIEGWHLFSFLELFGIAEHVNLRARLADIQRINEANKQAEQEAASPPPTE